MRNLTLVTTERFNNSINCDFYNDNNNELLLTRKQIGSALEYSNPDNAICKIHKRHKDRLDKFSVCDILSSTDGKTYETILYTRKGVMEICRYSNKPKANEFMDWVWDIAEKYIKGELVSMKDIQMILSKLVETTMQGFQNIDNHASNVFSVLENNTTTPKALPKRFTYWSSKMFPKYQALAKYFDV